jgi:hypothetical protein
VGRMGSTGHRRVTHTRSLPNRSIGEAHFAMRRTIPRRTTDVRPHPYQVSRAKRCADRRFPRSPQSVRGKGMRSNSRPDQRTDAMPWPRPPTPPTDRRQGDGAAGWARQPHRVGGLGAVLGGLAGPLLRRRARL